MASPEEQPAETLELFERFASVFNLTFTRFNDLKVAEAHALQAEHDLIEIKAARKKPKRLCLNCRQHKNNSYKVRRWQALESSPQALRMRYRTL